MSTILVIEGGGSGYRAYEVIGERIRMADKLPTAKVSPGTLVRFIAKWAERIGAQAVGVSTSGFVTDDGVITHSTNTGLPDDCRLAELVAKRFAGLPVKVINDLVAGTRGIAGIYPDLLRFLVKNLGEGDGQNEFDGGKVKPVDERGHMTLDLSPFGLPCACGLYGCEESIIGGGSLRRRVIWTIDALRLSKPKEMHPCAFLDQEYSSGTPWAVHIYDVFALALGMGLASLQLGGKFPCIIFRGTTIVRALALPGMQDMILDRMRRFLPDKTWGNVEFRTVPERDDMPKDYDAILGAAAFAEDALKTS